MMNTYIIKGADKNNGTERMVTIEAPDQRTAEQQANHIGLLVEDTFIDNDRSGAKFPHPTPPLTETNYYLRKIANKDRTAFVVLALGIAVVVVMFLLQSLLNSH
jgi:hypothetical protein